LLFNDTVSTEASNDDKAINEHEAVDWNGSNRRKRLTRDNFSFINPTWLDLESKPGRHCEDLNLLFMYPTQILSFWLWISMSVYLSDFIFWWGKCLIDVTVLNNKMQRGLFRRKRRKLRDSSINTYRGIIISSRKAFQYLSYWVTDGSLSGNVRHRSGPLHLVELEDFTAVTTKIMPKRPYILTKQRGVRTQRSDSKPLPPWKWKVP
jgi:hypothetical protein